MQIHETIQRILSTKPKTNVIFVMSKHWPKSQNLAILRFRDIGQDLVDAYYVPEVAAGAAGERALVQAQARGGAQVQIRSLHPFT